MKYSININQAAAGALNLLGVIDITDLAIFDTFKDFANSNRCEKMVDSGGKIWFWVSYDLIKKELPFARIDSKQAVYLRMKRLEKAGIIIFNPENQVLGKSFFCWGENYDALVSIPENETHTLGMKLPTPRYEITEVSQKPRYEITDPPRYEITEDYNTNIPYTISAAKAAASDSDESKNEREQGGEDEDRGECSGARACEDTGYSFDDFWQEYDFRKGSKKKALERWNRLKPIEREQIRQTLHLYKRQTKTVDNVGRAGAFIPMRKYPEFFLSAKVWEPLVDEVSETLATETTTQYDDAYAKYVGWAKEYHPQIVREVLLLSKQQFIDYKTRTYEPRAIVIGDESERNNLIWAHEWYYRPGVKDRNADVFSYFKHLINERLKSREI